MSPASRFAIAIGASALFLAAVAHAADEAVATCVACHGEGGNSAVPDFPKLAGQQANYIAKQLTDYHAGKRKNDIMAGALAAVKPADFKAIAAYFAAQKPAPGSAQDAALAAAGKKLYESGNDATGVAGCTGCHLAKGEGNESNPRVAGQHQAYALQQMKDFKTGARNNDKGRVMRVVAERMSEAEIKAVVEYMATM
jgi:cytochrome c553